MKLKSNVVLLAVGCFIAGFFACLFAVRPAQPRPIAASTPSPVVTLVDVAIAPQAPQADPFSHHDPDNALRALRAIDSGERTSGLRRGYYDLIDTQYRPGTDLKVSE